MDYLIRVISDEANVIGLACVSTAVAEHARTLHDASPVASAAIGRVLTGALLMGALLKMGQRVGLRVDGGGPIGKIIAEADSSGSVCGLASNPQASAPERDGKLNVAGVVGKEGNITVFKDTGIEEPYQGIVRLRSGEIAQDLAYYFAESEQIPTAVALGVYVEPEGNISAAGGFLIQSLPPSDENITGRLIENIETLPPLTECIRKGDNPEKILEALFAGIPFQVLEKRGLKYGCKCSRERIERVLFSLACNELKHLIEEGHDVEVKCEYCRTGYVFSRRDIEVIIRELEC